MIMVMTRFIWQIYVYDSVRMMGSSRIAIKQLKTLRKELVLDTLQYSHFPVNRKNIFQSYFQFSVMPGLSLQNIVRVLVVFLVRHCECILAFSCAEFRYTARINSHWQ